MEFEAGLIYGAILGVSLWLFCINDKLKDISKSMKRIASVLEKQQK